MYTILRYDSSIGDFVAIKHRPFATYMEAVAAMEDLVSNFSHDHRYVIRYVTPRRRNVRRG